LGRIELWKTLVKAAGVVARMADQLARKNNWMAAMITIAPKIAKNVGQISIPVKSARDTVSSSSAGKRIQ